MKYLDTPDGRIAYLDEGAGRPLVLLHGGGLDHRMWDQQVPGLAADHRVIAPDARGHGRPATPDGAYRHCDDLAALLRHLDTGPATLVGLSMGGGTAVDTALEHPELVRTLVVSGVGTSEPDFRDPWTLDILAEWRCTEEAGDAPGWIEAFMRFTWGRHRRKDDVDPEVVRRCREMVTGTLAAHVREAPVRPTPVTRTWERLPGITAPVLAVIGGVDGDDRIRMARRLVHDVPDGRAVTVEGTAHYPNTERPAEFDAHLRAFLRDTARSAA